MRMPRLILVLLPLALSHAASQAAEIQLRAAAHPAGALLLLGDVAEVFARDAKQAEELKHIELFPAPAQGNKRFVRLREVQDVMEQRGISLSEHTFSGANQVAVSVEAQAQPAAVLRVSRSFSVLEVRRAEGILREAITTYLEVRAPQQNRQIEFDLEDDAIRAILAAGKVAAISGGQAPWSGEQEFVAQLAASDAVAALAVRATVSVAPAIVVATHAVQRGAVIQAADVQLDRTQPTGKGDAATSLDDVIGKEAAQTIVAGQPIGRDDVRQPLLVRKGDAVTIYVRSPGVQVRTTARSKDNGSQGDLITVESLENRKSYFARVTGIQEAEVYARGQSAM